ncbi:MAG TPA: ABC transporter permease [Candidatus Angelobacter sp.]|nr:ABC transporter permease [Candidatus Angelobacter sp.]
MIRPRLHLLAHSAAAFVFPLAFVLAPLVAFLVYSFWRVENNQLIPDFTFASYLEFFRNEIYPRVFVGTLKLATQVMAIGLLLGYPVAYFIWRRRGRWRYALLLVSVVPLFMSYIIKLYAMRSILGINGFLNKALVALGLLDAPSLAFLYNQRAVLITMAVVYLPFAILPVFLSLERIPLGLIQASADLGARPGQSFRHVVLPLSLPGTIVGGLFVFILAMGDFVTPQMVGGTVGFTYGRVIQSQFGMGFNWPLGSALAVILLIVVLAVIGLAGVVGRRSRV